MNLQFTTKRSAAGDFSVPRVNSDRLDSGLGSRNHPVSWELPVLVEDSLLSRYDCLAVSLCYHDVT